METRNGLIIVLTFIGGLLIGSGLQLNRLLIGGITIWIVTAVYALLTRTRRLR
jgi:hypothetical protein